MNLLCRYHQIIDLAENELYIIVTLDSFQYSKTLNYHDLFLLWQDHFFKLNIPIYIIIPDDDQMINTIYDTYHAKLNYAHDINIFKQLSKEKIKYVFGKPYKIIYPSINLFEHDHILFERKRINNDAIKSTYLACIQKKYEIFIKKIKNSVDIPPDLW